jgi:hypothetical protein
MTDIDSAFGNWLAGFTDGEGCFGIYHVGGVAKRTFRCNFQIKLRSDDRAILREIQEKIGVGCLYENQYKANVHPITMFTVQSKPDCIILRDLFEEFPLRAKKATDFKIWSEALNLWLLHKPGDSWNYMVILKSKLEANRKYKEELCLTLTGLVSE